LVLGELAQQLLWLEMTAQVLCFLRLPRPAAGAGGGLTEVVGQAARAVAQVEMTQPQQEEREPQTRATLVETMLRDRQLLVRVVGVRGVLAAIIPAPWSVVQVEAEWKTTFLVLPFTTLPVAVDRVDLIHQLLAQMERVGPMPQTEVTGVI
jgi:hypothetical protein